MLRRQGQPGLVENSKGTEDFELAVQLDPNAFYVVKVYQVLEFFSGWAVWRSIL
jgi:hypothetical protein